MCMGNHHRVLDRLSSLGLCSINRRSNGTDNERSNMKRYYWSKIADGLYEKKVRKAKRKKKNPYRESRPIFRGLGQSNKTNRGPLGYMQ